MTLQPVQVILGLLVLAAFGTVVGTITSTDWLAITSDLVLVLAIALEVGRS